MGAGAGSVWVTVCTYLSRGEGGAVIMCMLLFNFTSRACDCDCAGMTERMSTGLSVWNLFACV